MTLTPRGTGTEDYTVKKIQRTTPVGIRGTGQSTYSYAGLIYIPGSTSADIEFEDVTPPNVLIRHKVVISEVEAYVGTDMLLVIVLLKKGLLEKDWVGVAVGTEYQKVRLPVSPGFDYTEVDNIGLRIYNLDSEAHTFFYTIIGTEEEILP